MLPEAGRVVGDDDELRLAGPEGLQRLLVAEAVLARLGDHLQAGIDVLRGLLLKRQALECYRFFRA